MSKLNHDIKYMYRGSTGYSIILAITDEEIMKIRGSLHEIGKALTKYVFSNLGLQVISF